jgi:GT2 family glycosyltransferase
MVNQPGPKVEMILLNYNGLEDTLECVASLEKLTYRNYSIIIVDNGSRPEQREGLKRELGATCTIIETGANLGFAKGFNVGMRYALGQGAQYLLIMNNDIVVSPDALTRLLEEAEADPTIGLLSPRIYYYSRPQYFYFPMQTDRLPPLLKFHLGYVWGVLNSWRVNTADRISDVTCIDGCFCLIKRKVLEKVGLFDHVFPYGSYEVPSLCQRVANAGFRMVAVPDTSVWHKVGKSTGDQRAYEMASAFRVSRNCVIFARRHLSLPHYLLFLTMLPVHILAWLAPSTWRTRSLRGLPNILRGLREGFTWQGRNNLA